MRSSRLTKAIVANRKKVVCFKKSKKQFDAAGLPCFRDEESDCDWTWRGWLGQTLPRF